MDGASGGAAALIVSESDLLAIPDRAREPIPRGWAEKWLSQVREVPDLRKLNHGAASLQGYIAAWKKKGYETAELDAALRYTEARIGEVLGPPPGHGPGRGEKIAGDQSFLTTDERFDFRRMGAHFPLVVEAVRNGMRSRGAVLRYIDEQTTAGLDDPAPPEIRRGDFRIVLADVAPDSVPLILTDPPYPALYLPLWAELARFAARVLVPGGSLLAYSGQGNLLEVMNRLSAELRYWWTLALVHGHGSQNLPGKFVTIGWKPVLWFVKERRRDSTYVADRINGSPPRRGVQDWAQGQDELLPLIRSLTMPEEVIVDPFAGSGTVGYAALAAGRRFLGAELADGERWER
jgi:hypothetical protein